MIRSIARLVVVVALAVIACHVPVYAATFSDFIDFGDPGLGPDTAGSISLFDTDAPQWLHDITDTLGGVPAGVLIPSAKMTLSFRGTDGSESWSLLGDGLALGTLSVTTKLLTQEFILPPMALDALAIEGKLNIALVESTSSRDGIGLYEATLTGTYELPPTQQDPSPATTPSDVTHDPVSTPELPSGWLMAPVLLGLLMQTARRRRSSNVNEAA